MAISCDCDSEWDVGCAGDPRFVTCRTPRKCYACKKKIEKLDGMYMQSLYDYRDSKFASPVFVCEECGDMALNLIDSGYCFSWRSSIVGQWEEYRKLTDKKNA